MTPVWFRPYVWMDYRLSLLFILIIPLILLIWAFVQKAESMQRLLMIYFKVASLLAITIYLMIGNFSASFISALMGRILIPISLWFWVDINDEIDYSIDLETIQECFHEYVNVNPPKKQDSLTGRRLNKSPNTSIAYYIALYVIGMDDETLGQFVPLLGMDNDELEMVEEV